MTPGQTRRLTVKSVELSQITYKRPRKTGDAATVKITMTIPLLESEDTRHIKDLIDFAHSGPCSWTIGPVQKELANA